MRAGAPSTYRNLTGRFGLGVQFVEWRQLVVGGASDGGVADATGAASGAVLSAEAARARLVGLSFQTTGICTAYSDPKHFAADGTALDAKDWSSDGRGFCVVNKHKESKAMVWELQESDVVEFRSSAPDETGMHSLILNSPFGHYHLPPMTTVTVDEVKPAGSWRAHGVTVQRALIVVSVSFVVE